MNNNNVSMVLEQILEKRSLRSLRSLAVNFQRKVCFCADLSSFGNLFFTFTELLPTLNLTRPKLERVGLQTPCTQNQAQFLR